MKGILRSLQPILWSTPLAKLSLNKHKTYIIHQVLMYGDFQDIRWLFRTYSKKEIKNVFINKPQKIYTKEAFNYIKDFILEINSKSPSPQKYVSTLGGQRRSCSRQSLYSGPTRNMEGLR